MKKELIMAAVIAIFLLLNFIFIPDYYRAASKIQAQAERIDTLDYSEDYSVDENAKGFYHMQKVDVLFEAKNIRNPLLQAYEATTNKLLWEHTTADKKIIILPPKHIIELEKQKIVDTLPLQHILSGIDVHTGAVMWKTNLGELGLNVELIQGMETLLITYEKKEEMLIHNDHAYQVIDLNTGQHLKEETIHYIPSIQLDYFTFEALQKKDWSTIDYYPEKKFFFDKKTKEFFKLESTGLLKAAIKVCPTPTHWVFVEENSVLYKDGNVHAISKDKNKQQWQKITYADDENIHIENQYLVLHQKNVHYLVYYLYNLDNLHEPEAAEKVDKGEIDERFSLIRSHGRLKCIIEENNNSIYINGINTSKIKELKMNIWRGKRFFRQKDDWLYIYEYEKEPETRSPKRIVYKYTVPFHYESQ